jgi:glycerol-3-phosphate acyltransferase PlsY
VPSTSTSTSTLPSRAVLALGAGFLAGAIPFSQIAAWRCAGVDLRDVGTRTVSGTSLYRVAGFRALAVAGVADVAKGAVGPLVAGRRHPQFADAAGALAVAGHNWSPFLAGAGGRGISPALGALLVRHPAGAAVLLAGLVVGRLLRGTGLGSFVADCALVPVLAAVEGREAGLAGAMVVTPMIAKRLAAHGPPPTGAKQAYLWRLLLDRDTRYA